MLQRLLLTLSVLTMILAGCQKEETLALGIVKPVDHPTLNATYQGVIDQISDYNQQNEKSIEIVDLVIQNSQIVSNDSSVDYDDIDLLLAISSKSLYDLCQTNTNIPIIFSAVSDLESIEIERSIGIQEGIMTGVSDMIPIKSQFQLLRKILPNLKTVGVIFNPEEKLSLSQIELIKSYSTYSNIKFIYKEVNSAEAAINAAKNLLGEIDALYIPSDLTITPVIHELVVWTDLASKPIISGDERGIEQGALCTVIVDYYKLGQQTGKIVIEGLTRKMDLENSPIENSKNNKILINTEVASKLSIVIPSELQ